VIDAFRLINPQAVLTGQQTRQTTSNIGHLHKPSIQALIHGLNRSYYSMAINYVIFIYLFIYCIIIIIIYLFIY
jgi:26S proteasome regulatory subunit N11